MNDTTNQFECKLCGHRFDSKIEMKKHAMDTHPEMKSK